MDSVQQIYVTNQTPLSQTFQASKPNLMEKFIGADTTTVELFFNIFTSGIETFVIPWDHRLYPCVVEVCHLGRIETFVIPWDHRLYPCVVEICQLKLEPP